MNSTTGSCDLTQNKLVPDPLVVGRGGLFCLCNIPTKGVSAVRLSAANGPTRGEGPFGIAGSAPAAAIWVISYLSAPVKSSLTFIIMVRARIPRVRDGGGEEALLSYNGARGDFLSPGTI